MLGCNIFSTILQIAVKVIQDLNKKSHESGEMDVKKWIVYCLKGHKTNKTYVGSTNNFERRLRQHNGTIVGGAKVNHPHINFCSTQHVLDSAKDNQ